MRGLRRLQGHLVRRRPGQDITDDHVDATSRFLSPGEALVQMPLASENDAYARDARQQFSILSASTTS
ncbi:hypothetical protein ACFSUJ_35140, partial [Streptomyces lusitanus]